MKYTRIPIYIDFLFCAIIIPLVITLLPVDQWIVNNRADWRQYAAASQTWSFSTYR